MSSQQSQRMRRNVSPAGSTRAEKQAKSGGKQGPMRATVPLSLMHQTCSPTRSLNQKGSNSPSNSPPVVNWPNDPSKVKTRHSPDNRISPETQSPGSPGFKAEKSKPATKSVSSAPFIRRTASVDTIYLLGQWQRDALYLSYCGRLMMDRATQTPEEFDDIDKRPVAHKKSTTASGEQLEMKFIRQRLQRTNHNSRGSGPSNSYQRHSPVHGDHFAISSSSSAAAAAVVSGGTTSPILPSSAAISPHHLSCNVPVHSIPTPCIATTAAATAPCSRAVPIPIPDIPKPLVPRMRSSVEGLNQEIERLVLREISSIDGDEMDRILEPTPEGHRAPIADLFRITHTVDTQTPFNRGGSCHSSNSPNSRSHSISPVAPIIPGQMDGSRPSSTEYNRESGSPEAEGFCKLATSPHINKFLAREPPDGCEKVKIVEETRSSVALREHKEYGCPKPSVNFVLLPSQSSAFYPLCKNCVMSSSEEITVEHSTTNAHSSTSERLQ